MLGNSSLSLSFWFLVTRTWPSASWLAIITEALNLKPSYGVSRQILNFGITSIASNEDGSTVALGTKAGKILHSTNPISSDHWENLSQDDFKSKYPIFSLCFGRCQRIFAGSGDRFVSSWCKEGTEYRLLRRAGPHTGWVKALAYHKETNVLFSIGCNCIESWNCTDTGMNHISKRMIENSPELGSTISSDLLSLCIVEDIGLLSGGVDGRMHLWSIDPIITSPLYSCPLHEGRVNVIVHSPALQLVFSGSHDGKIVASKVDGRSIQKTSEICMDDSPRISAMTVVSEDHQCCRLVLGTADGRISVVDIEEQNGIISINGQNKFHEIEKESMVYCISTGKGTSKSTLKHIDLLVGHAKGLTLLRERA